MAPAPDANALDAELVARMARGDRAALAELYRRHRPRLLALGQRFLGKRAAAEDLLHDVFLEAWRHAEDYSEERGTVAAWLGLRTRSRAIDRKRSASHTRTQALSEAMLEDLTDPSEDPARTSDQRRLELALGSMGVEEQKVILLGYFEGLSSSEIAERVGAPLGTVKSRTRNALTKLRAFFDSDGGTE